MGNSAGEVLLRRVYDVVRAARLVEEFETAERFTLRIENEPYLPLVIESWPTPDPLQGERRRVLVAHYFRQNERDFPDPEVELTEFGFPVRSRQTVFGIMETLVLFRNPHTQQVMVNMQGKRDLADLLRVWAKNIRYQRFVVAASRIVTSQGTEEIHAVVPPECTQQPKAGAETSTEEYQAGVAAAQIVNPEQYTRLLQLQALAKQHGYAPDEWGRPTRQQILFILGVCASFREMKLEAVSREEPS